MGVIGPSTLRHRAAPWPPLMPPAPGSRPGRGSVRFALARGLRCGSLGGTRCRDCRAAASPSSAAFPRHPQPPGPTSRACLCSPRPSLLPIGAPEMGSQRDCPRRPGWHLRSLKQFGTGYTGTLQLEQDVVGQRATCLAREVGLGTQGRPAARQRTTAGGRPCPVWVEGGALPHP